MTPAVDLVYAAASGTSSHAEEALQERAGEIPWEETVAGQMVVERYDVRVAVGENGGGFEALFAWLRGEKS